MKPITLRRKIGQKSHKSENGVTLIVGLIMLILITLMVTTAFTLSGTNLKAVGNMQFRNESIAAGNKAIEYVIGNNFPAGFLSVPPAQTITLDINNDGTPDYTALVDVPVCIQSTTVASAVTTEGTCGGVRAGALAGCTISNYSTLWDVKATVTDALSGAQVTINQGFRQELTQTQLAAVCP